MIKRSFLLPFFALLLLIGQANAGDFVIPKQTLVGADAPVDLGDIVVISVSKIEKDAVPKFFTGASYHWEVLEFNKNEFKAKRFFEQGDTIHFGSGTVAKRFHVKCTAVYTYGVKNEKGDAFVEYGFRINVLSAHVDIGGTPPPTPGPGPAPGPNPPNPPDPKDIIPATGLSAVVIHESAERSNYPPSQVAAMFSAIVREYTNTKYPGGFMILDKDDDTSKLPEFFKVAMKRPRASMPWLIISNGQGVQFEGPYETTVTKALEVFKKYGG